MSLSRGLVFSLYYSPKSLRDGLVASELAHASITFHFWISDGLMFFEAFDSLILSFVVPILVEGHVDETSEPYNLLAVLVRKHSSSRWWIIKNYMAVAADVQEGQPFNMESFLRISKDHEDHSDISDKLRNLVYIQGEVLVDYSFLTFQKT